MTATNPVPAASGNPQQEAAEQIGRGIIAFFRETGVPPSIGAGACSHGMAIALYSLRDGNPQLCQELADLLASSFVSLIEQLGDLSKGAESNGAQA